MKGGDESSILPHSEGLAAYFDYQQNATETSWTDIVGGLSLEGDFVLSDDSMVANARTNIPILLKDCYTVYIIFKNSNMYPLDYWSGVFVNDKNIFGIYDNRGKIGIYNDYAQYQYTSDMTTTNYHICTITFCNGFGSLYIDDVLKYTKANNALPDVYYFITGIGANKMIALCNNVAHRSKYVAENTQFLAEKYGIEI